MNADDFQPVGADIFEAGNIGRPDDDIAGRAACFVIANRKLGLAFADHPRFRIGVHVQCRPAPGIRIDDKERYFAAKLTASCCRLHSVHTEGPIATGTLQRLLHERGHTTKTPVRSCPALRARSDHSPPTDERI